MNTIQISATGPMGAGKTTILNLIGELLTDLGLTPQVYDHRGAHGFTINVAPGDLTNIRLATAVIQQARGGAAEEAPVNPAPTTRQLWEAADEAGYARAVATGYATGAEVELHRNLNAARYDIIFNERGELRPDTGITTQDEFYAAVTAATINAAINSMFGLAA
ncbi:hypothetical protein LAV_00073 [Sphingobium phage Lacusarx]|uniref:Uncharacterized protein n=1 Tax=Sphingobium phage Lacusarx TaxID=1980139 RepID=A0A1W6DX27_9CAUD|nr:hypothetical protein FDH44_gp073 [Sphingobium phage Lacusarx]ARK07473.1 hypothetical protein LAV_00073 [Sphingobium phage Lacusarx]